MSLTLQILLIIFTVLFFIILVKNVKKGKLRTDYALAWILCSIALIILSIFPQIAFFVARLIGVISTANIVFAAIIFMLIILVYVLFNKVSMLEEKQKNLIQEIREEIYESSFNLYICNFYFLFLLVNRRVCS